ncbi:helix-turn-helix domain-containing protein [Brucella intermedia]|uniref:helix-turn-helix domain-containing protein n=1 Tax=Brucella intermedia TaxID=94625 RepID=UPI00235F4FDF|nr:helix-turn-helix domain-containing protein [Brucella intermedia]
MDVLTRPNGSLPWQNRAFVSLQLAAEISGVSRTTLYRFADARKLRLKRLGGRVVVATQDLIQLIDAAEDWRPSSGTKPHADMGEAS